ncbi:MAG TPA: DUF6790 family protein [Candidatus Rubrimentiphilum sp.]|nr:DUF6790 family protein [Candidatus Rubrimentiphilum sp.]
MIETAIRTILGNFELVLIVVAIVVTILKLRRAKMHRTVMTPAYTLWGELLFYGIGFGFLWAGIFHAFFQQTAAAAIGWQPSPFEWELAWGEFGVAIIALLSLARGYEMRLATTLVFFIFSAGATIQHINQMICCHNYAPGNAGTILWINDIALPLVLLFLAYSSRDAYERSRVR